MADEVATVSSSPAFGFAAVVISDQSYSGAPPGGRCGGRVDEADGKPREQELAELPDQIREREFLADRHRAEVRARDVGPHEQSERDAELQALGQAASTFIALRVNPRGDEH